MITNQWVNHEENRAKVLNTMIESLQYSDNAVAVDIILKATSYDSNYAYCYDQWYTIASYVDVNSEEAVNLAIEAVAEYLTKDGFDFSNPDRVEYEDGYYEEYGHKLCLKEYTQEQVEAKAKELTEELAKLQALL